MGSAQTRSRRDARRDSQLSGWPLPCIACSRLCAALAVLLISQSLSAKAGEAEVQLTSDSLFKRDPVFVGPEGKELVYVVLSRPEQLQIMRMNLADRSAKPIHKDEVRSELEPAFSPDGRFYSHLQSRSPASVAMMIRDAKEKRDVEIPPAPGFSGMRSPAFSADGKRVLYAFGEDGRQQIFSVNLQAKDRKTVVDSRGLNNWPHCSPDGRHVVFSSTRDGNFELYVCRTDGTGVRRLTEHDSQDIRPRFSPDSKRITFTSNRDGNYEIYLINSDGTGLSRLTENAEKDDYPSWHPDGRRIVYVSERSGRQDLFLLPVE